MYKLISVTNSDSRNLYGDRCTIGALVRSTYEACVLGIPTNYGHDSSKPIGWSFPLGVYFEPGLSRSVALTQLIETDDEQHYFRDLYTRFYIQKKIEPNKLYIDKLRCLLNNCLKGKEEIIVNEAVSIYEQDLVIRKFPELVTLFDKDGLIPINFLEPLGSGIFKKGEFLLFADGCFRRSHFISNSLNHEFIKRLFELDQEKVNVRIAIDHNLIGLADSYYGEKIELEYWWGPKFDNDLVKIPSGLARHEADDDQRRYFGLIRTEFHWGNQSGKKIFEVEELRDIPVNFLQPDKFGCRYSHAIVNVESGIVEHFDGAIRSYSEEKMVERLETNLDRASRDTDYKKLWRIDGEIDVCTWKALLSDYFRNNPLIGEYLGAEDEIINKRKIVESSREKSIKELYVPFSLQRDSGLRIALSIIPSDNISESDTPTVISFDHIAVNENDFTFVEAQALELKKILGFEGIELKIPQDISFVSFKDKYVNLPLIYIHEDIEKKIDYINRAINKLIHFIQEKYGEVVLVYKYGFPIDPDRVVLISVMGPSSSMYDWFENELSGIPSNIEELICWAESVGDYLKRYKLNLDKPSLTEVLMSTGVLSINRKLINVIKATPVTSSKTNKKNIQFEIELTDEDNSKKERLQKENIKPSLGFLIQESRCTNCGMDYRICPCSKLIGMGTAQEILKAIPFSFWTD